MNKYMLFQNDTQWSKWLPKIISVYNKTPHAFLNNCTPDEVSANVNGMEKRFRQDANHNQVEDAMESPISGGDTVRILERHGSYSLRRRLPSKVHRINSSKDLGGSPLTSFVCHCRAFALRQHRHLGGSPLTSSALLSSSFFRTPFNFFRTHFKSVSGNVRKSKSQRL
jgi:hypothetical protein